MSKKKTLIPPSSWFLDFQPHKQDKEFLSTFQIVMIGYGKLNQLSEEMSTAGSSTSSCLYNTPFLSGIHSLSVCASSNAQGCNF